MYLEVTPKNNPNDRVYVNFATVQVIMRNDTDDYSGTVLIFDVGSFDRTSELDRKIEDIGGPGSPLCMLILDDYDVLMDRILDL